MTRIIWDSEKGWHDNGPEVVLSIQDGKLVTEEMSEMVTEPTIAFPMTQKELTLFLNVIDRGRGSAMRQIHRMFPTEIDVLKRRIRLALSDEFNVEPKV